MVVWLAAPQAHAQRSGGPAREPAPLVRPGASGEARRQFMIGERLFRAGRYRDAARAYQRGYRLSGRPGFLINIAHCQVRLGRLELAREQYRRFLAEAPDAPHAAQVARALAEIDSQLAPRPAATPESPVDAAPLAPSVPAGAALAEVAAPPPLPLTARDRLHQPSAAEQALRLQAPPPPPRSSHRRWLWPVVGVAAAALVTGTVAVLAGRDQRAGTLSRGSIGTIRR